MKRFLTKRPADFRFVVAVGLAVGISQSVFRGTEPQLGLVGGLLATAASGGLIALVVGLLWPAPKPASPEAMAADQELA